MTLSKPALVILFLLATGGIAWWFAGTPGHDSEMAQIPGDPTSDATEPGSLNCRFSVADERAPIWQPGQGREEFAALTIRAESGDPSAAWDLHRAIDYCFGIPDSDRELRREVDRLRGEASAKETSSGQGQLPDDHPATDAGRQEEILREKFGQCKDVPRAPGTAYVWLQRAAAGGEADAQLVFHQQGLRYAGDELPNRGPHIDESIKYLQKRLDAGDGRALPRLAQIRQYEAALTGRAVSPDPIEVYSLYYAASLYVTHDARLKDWRPAWKAYLAGASATFTDADKNTARQRAESLLASMDCEG